MIDGPAFFWPRNPLYDFTLATSIRRRSERRDGGGAKILRLLLTNYKLREGKQPTLLNSYKATLDEELRKIAEDLEVVVQSLT